MNLNNRVKPMKCLKYHLALLLSIVVMLASCGSDSFKIEGAITNLDGGTLKVIYIGDSGVVDELVNLDKKRKFSFEGHSAQPALVSLLNRQGKPLAMLVAANGDYLKVNGDASKEMGIKVKGNRLNEDWQLFRIEHKSFYTDINPSRLDAAIEKYVRENPADILSTVLLLADYSDYSDRNKLKTLLDGIEAQARPKSLAQMMESRAKGNRLAGHLPRLATLNLMALDGDFEEIKLTSQTTLIHLWANPQSGRRMVIDKLKGLGETIRVLDVLAESDTLRWGQTIADDPEGWKHYWAPAGPLEQGLQLLGFTSLPWYVVTDSTGLVVYSGSSLDEASMNALDKLADNMKNKGQETQN